MVGGCRLRGGCGLGGGLHRSLSFCRLWEVTYRRSVPFLAFASLDAGFLSGIPKSWSKSGGNVLSASTYRPMAKKYASINKNEGCATNPLVTGVKSAREHWSATRPFRHTRH
jgi:hypothetical protein